MKVFIVFVCACLGLLACSTLPTSAATSTSDASQMFVPSTDADGDGLSNTDEITYFHTDPFKADTDNDGFLDGSEILNGYNPLGAGRAPTSSKRVEVDLTNQTLTYFYNDKPLGTIPVSTGLPIWHTPTGTFAVFAKKLVVNYTGVNYSYPNTKWNLEFLPHIYLHGAFWHNQFGIRPMSHGCVNIAYKDVEKLYGFLDIGSQVKVIGVTPRRVEQVAGKTLVGKDVVAEVQ